MDKAEEQSNHSAVMSQLAMLMQRLPPPPDMRSPKRKSEDDLPRENDKEKTPMG